MTVLPDLEQALITAARRRRRRPPVRALVIAALAAAALVAVALTSGLLSSSAQRRASPAEPQRVEVPRTPTGRRARLSRTYSVFTRPRRAVDRIPNSTAGPRRSRLAPGVVMDLSQSRQVAVFGDVRAYAAPGVVAGRLAICETTVLRSGAGGTGCSKFNPAAAARRPLSSRTTVRPSSVYFALLPDSVDRATLVLREGGQSITTPVKDNAVLFRPPSGARRLEWRLTDGSLKTVKFYDDPDDDTD